MLKVKEEAQYGYTFVDPYGWEGSTNGDYLEEISKIKNVQLWNYPPVPYEDSGACPFEGCVYREWIATKKTPIQMNREANSSIAFTINKGESVTAITGVVITTTPGENKVLKPIKIGDVTANIGDIVYILTHLGEGVSKIWYKGNLWIPGLNDLDNLEYKKTSKYTWWVQVKNSNGQIGWTNQPENFSNKDLFG